MGILIFLGTAVIIYIVLNKLNNKETYNNSWNSKINLDLNEGYNIINSNISDDKLILTINNKTHYKIIIYDLNKDNKNEIRNKATVYGTERIPAVAVNGKLLECCDMSSVSENILRQAGVGSA